jgi:hypothetical protein
MGAGNVPLFFSLISPHFYPVTLNFFPNKLYYYYYYKKKKKKKRKEKKETAGCLRHKELVCKRR